MAKQSRISNPQRRIAAKLLKCGESRVWMDPATVSKISRAITRNDVKKLIREGAIKKLDAKKNNSDKTPMRQGSGSRKGAKGAREGKKDNWFRIVRPQRKLLKDLRTQMKPKAYRRLYLLVKGGAFRSRVHLQSYIKDNNMLTQTEKRSK